jgi:hypothetical protein
MKEVCPIIKIDAFVILLSECKLYIRVELNAAQTKIPAANKIPTWILAYLTRTIIAC